jgi:hypothetical protein
MRQKSDSANVTIAAPATRSKSRQSQRDHRQETNKIWTVPLWPSSMNNKRNRQCLRSHRYDAKIRRTTGVDSQQTGRKFLSRKEAGANWHHNVTRSRESAGFRNTGTRELEDRLIPAHTTNRRRAQQCQSRNTKRTKSPVDTSNMSHRSESPDQQPSTGLPRCAVGQSHTNNGKLEAD